MAENSRWDGWLSPRAWIPAAAVLGIVMLGAGVFAGWQWVADEKQSLTVESCQIGEEGCEARQAVHWHADFALFIDGKQFDFGGDEFISTEEEEKSAYAHIHEPRETVVHVHYSGTTWQDWFQILGFDLSDKMTPAGKVGAPTCLTMPDGTKHCEGNGKTFKFIVNGVKVDGIATSDITDLDRVLISYGAESLEDVQKNQLPQVTDEACIPSERCPERGSDPEEPCKGQGTCTYVPRRERDWAYA